MYKVLFVCLGNICRSPTAEAAFRHQVQAQGLTDQIGFDSCGTAAYHVGSAPDQRSQQAAANRGIKMADLRARAFELQDFDQFDLILAMDLDNLEFLQREAERYGKDAQQRVALFLDYTDGPQREVPDPYYGGPQGFERVLDLVETAAERLLAQIKSSGVARQ